MMYLNKGMLCALTRNDTHLYVLKQADLRDKLSEKCKGQNIVSSMLTLLGGRSVLCIVTQASLAIQIYLVS